MAEGVEDTDGLRLATSLGVEFVQGFCSVGATRRSARRAPGPGLLAAPRPSEPEPTGTGRAVLRGLR
ncbi:MAG: hypothetical protein R2705_01960 [Ilumatobacteraceae bacterium]